MTGTPGGSVPDRSAKDPLEIGGYIVERRIGRGGQATVYLCRDGAGEAVAVKVFDRSWLGDPEGPRQVRAEIEALRAVAAFGTARLIEAHPEQDPAYLVSEYVPGPDLQAAVRSRGPLRGAELDRFALATLTALRSVHEAGLVHRDIKPGNVILGPDGPRLVDFGLVARSGDVEDPSDGVLGTRDFLAPELFDGASVLASGDLYAWAATVAFAASGRAPSGAQDDLPGVPGGLADVLRRCLDADPEQRPDAESATDLVLQAARRSRHEPPPPIPAVPPAPTPDLSPDPAPALAPAPAPDPAPAAPAVPDRAASGSGVPAWGTPGGSAGGARPWLAGSSAGPSAPRAAQPSSAPRAARPSSAPHWSPPPPPPPARPSGAKWPWVIAGMVAWVAIGFVLLTQNTSQDTGGSSWPDLPETLPSSQSLPSSLASDGPGDAGTPPAAESDGPAEPSYSPVPGVPTDVVMGRLLSPPAAESSVVPAVSVAADGSTVSAQVGCVLRRWRTADGAVVHSTTLAPVDGACVGAESPDGRYTVVRIASGVRISDTRTKQVKGTVPLGYPAERFAFPADGERVLLGRADSGIVVADLATGTVKGATIEAGEGAGLGWMAGPDGEMIVVPDRPDGGARTYYTGSTTPRDLVDTGPWRVPAAAASSFAVSIAVVDSSSGDVTVWRTLSNRQESALPSAGVPIQALSFIGQEYLVGVGPRGGFLWDIYLDRFAGPRLAFPASAKATVKGVTITDLQASLDGSAVVARTSSGAVVVWQLPQP